MISTDKLNWYAAYTRVNQELVIKKKLDELGVENYLPQEERVRETPLGRKKIRVILIHGLIFIRTDKTTSFSLLNDHLLNIVYLKDREGRCSLIIPDKQMEDFMFLLDFSTDGVEVLNKDLKRGDRVRVIKGPLLGLEESGHADDAETDSAYLHDGRDVYHAGIRPLHGIRQYAGY